MTLRTVQNDPFAKERRRDFWKRGLDLVLASICLALLSPFLLIIALSILVTSPGPVLYHQRRVGLQGRSFAMLKFRTMYADQCTPDPLLQHGRLVKPANDPRVTPFGRYLRRFSLDELPQFWNVLVGDMSFVGPRPLPHCMLTAEPDVLGKRASVRPGITGLWQIHSRRLHRSVHDMLEHDLAYVRSQSIATDILILLTTLTVVLKGEGAV